jgi:hypothetical protein
MGGIEAVAHTPSIPHWLMKHTFEVFAFDTLAIPSAQHSCTKAFTIFLHAAAFLAVASAVMRACSVMSTWHNIEGRWTCLLKFAGKRVRVSFLDYFDRL